MRFRTKTHTGKQRSMYLALAATRLINQKTHLIPSTFTRSTNLHFLGHAQAHGELDGQEQDRAGASHPCNDGQDEYYRCRCSRTVTTVEHTGAFVSTVVVSRNICKGEEMIIQTTVGMEKHAVSNSATFTRVATTLIREKLLHKNHLSTMNGTGITGLECVSQQGKRHHPISHLLHNTIRFTMLLIPTLFDARMCKG